MAIYICCGSRPALWLIFLKVLLKANFPNMRYGKFAVSWSSLEKSATRGENDHERRNSKARRGIYFLDHTVHTRLIVKFEARRGQETGNRGGVNMRTVPAGCLF